MLGTALCFAGMLVLLALLATTAISATKKVRMLYTECVNLNTRWRMTCEFLTRKCIRDALYSKQEWTTRDERALHEYAQQLESMGVSLKSLGMSDSEIAACTGRVVH